MEKVRKINFVFFKDGLRDGEHYAYDFNSLKDYFGMITEINNLGINNTTKISKVGNRFVLVDSTEDALDLTFNINFTSYEKYREFVKRCNWSKNYITVNYSVPVNGEYKVYKRDYYLKSIAKSEKKIGILVCPVVLQPITFWYELQQFNLKAVSNEWVTVEIDNSSDLDSEIYFRINSIFTNLIFQVFGDDFDVKKMNLKYSMPTDYLELKFLYSSADNDSYIKTVGKTNTLEKFEEDLLNIEHVDFNDENIFKIPAGKKATVGFKFDEIPGEYLKIFLEIRKYFVSV